MKTNMRTAVIYARYSSDIQGDRSIDDQIALCRQLADRHGCKVVEVFTDRAKSGAFEFERDGLLALKEAARHRTFDVVIVEAMSRLSRSQVDGPAIFRFLEWNKVKIIDRSGDVTDIHVGVNSIVDSIFLKNLRNCVKRGMDGHVRDGLVPGKLAYGYRLVPGKPGMREIEPEHAKIVVWIFEQYVSGKSPRQIALELSQRGIPSPRGDKFWNHQKLLGGSSGLLLNQLYIGKLIWNKRTNIKNPETGRIHRRATPEDVITVDVPHLRIVDQALWDQAQAVREERSLAKFGPTGKTYTKKPEHFLVSLLKCGACSGRMVIGQLGRDRSRRIVCASGYRDMGCAHRKSYDLATLEATVLAGIKARLTDRKTLLEMTRAYHGQWQERQKETRSDRDTAQKQLNRVTVKIDRIVAAIASDADDSDPVELMKVLKTLRVEKAGLTERLKVIDSEANVVDLHPKAIDRFAEMMDRVHEGLSSKLNESQLSPFRMAFSSVFDRIVVHPTEKRQPYEITPYARLGAIMGIELFPKMSSEEEMLAEQGVVVNSKTAPSACRYWQNRNNFGLISLGRWRAAA